MGEKRIAKARSDLAMAETSHLLEVERLRGQVETSADTAKYQNMNLVNEHQQKRIHDLEDQIVQKQPELKELSNDLEVNRLKKALQDNVNRLNLQLQKTAKSDLL